MRSAVDSGGGGGCGDGGSVMLMAWDVSVVSHFGWTATSDPCIFCGFWYGPTDQRRDGQTEGRKDGQTGRPSYIEARMHQKEFSNGILRQKTISEQVFRLFAP